MIYLIEKFNGALKFHDVSQNLTCHVQLIHLGNLMHQKFDLSENQ